MLETYNVVLTNSARNLKRNIVTSPVLYILFSIMMVFSIFMIGFLTIFFIRNSVPISLNDIFYVVLFLFVLKASYDFYNYFTKSESLTYAFSTEIPHFKTVFEVFMVVFWNNLGLWVFLSTLYHLVIITSGVNLVSPFIYLKYTFGVMLGIVLGCITVLHYFSKKKYRLMPLGFFYLILYLFHDFYSVLLVLFFAFCYLLFSLIYSKDSFLFVSRKDRKKEKNQVSFDKPIKAVFFKEITVLWRERVFNSIIFSAAFVGAGAGYIARFGAEDLLPESLQAMAARISPETYAFFGIYMLTIHGAVFISLSLFLNEENTICLLRHLPIKMEKIVYGKALSLVFPFFCSIPFIAYYSAFTSGESMFFLIWFLLFSYLMGVIICFPIGAKYVGKKSDILLLYSVSLFILLILGISFSIGSVLNLLCISNYLIYALVIVIELLFVYISLQIAAGYLEIKYKKIL